MVRFLLNALKRFVVLSSVALVVMSLGGCHSPVSISHAESGLLANDKFIVIQGIDLPKVQGVNGCGAQALAAALAFNVDELDTSQLAEELPWHDYGATPVELLLEARQRGRTARVEKGEWDSLEKYVVANQPIVVMLDAGYEVRWFFSRYDLPKVMHWALVSGMGSDGKHLLLAAEKGRYHKVQREDFMRRWNRSDRCAIVIDSSQKNSPRRRGEVD